MKTVMQDIIESRISVNHFQADRPLDDDAIESLVSLATKAPSAYNLQNWRFIAVRSKHAKTNLEAAAYGQQKIVDASVAFIICGTLAEHQQLATTLRSSIMDQQMINGWVRQANAAHEGNPALQRDEAIRSASLAAMTLILAAQGMGLGSCAMSGFDTAQVIQAFELRETEFPVMIVAVGYPANGNWPQKPRKTLSTILSIV